MANPTNTSDNSNRQSSDTNNDTQSWWLTLTSTPVDNSSDFNPDAFTQEVESASWLDIFAPRK